MALNIKPPRTVDSDVARTIERYEELVRSKQEEGLMQTEYKQYPGNGRPIRVLFYFFKNVHIPILLPVFEEMCRQGGFDIAFSYYHHDLRIRAGMTPEEFAILERQGVPLFENPREWNADVTLMADNVAKLVEGCGKIVNVGHGLLSKGQYFTDTDIVHRENLEDLLCVPGPYHKQRLLDGNRVFIPVVATGMPKLDRLFSPDRLSRDDLMRQMGLDLTKRVVLFAPTFNIALSSIPILWTRVEKLADDDTYLFIKLHNSTLNEFKEHYRELAQRHPNVIYVDDPDITASMLVADVMVSDVSSAFMEFICLDKPVVLFDNPNQSTYRNYDPRDIEYAWRDVGLRANSLEGVIEGVRRSFEHPEEYQSRRREYAAQLLADRSGGASRNVVNVVRDLLHGQYAPERVSTDTTALLIPVGPGDERAAIESTRLALEDGGEACRVHLIDHGCTRGELLRSMPRDSRVKVIGQDVVEAVTADATYVVLLKAGLDMGERRLFRLVNHLRRNPDARAFVPLFSGEEAQQSPDQHPFHYVAPDVAKTLRLELFDRELRHAIPAQSLPHKITGATCCIAARRQSEGGTLLMKHAKENRRSTIPEVGLALDVVVGNLASVQATQGSPPDVDSTDSDGMEQRDSAEDGRLRVAYHYERKGKYEKAAEHAQKVLAEDEANVAARDLLERVEARLS
ncbi:hypothetical protein GF324_11350 [bacterium]|nr:hypothetical protein [bacterium]